VCPVWCISALHSSVWSWMNVDNIGRRSALEQWVKWVIGCTATQSGQWFTWGPVQMQCRLCAACWTYWKKYGGLKMPTRLG